MENIDSYKDLANAIVVCAADDYRKALETLKCKPYDYAAIKNRNLCEHFFQSDWFTVLTNLEGRMIMHRLKEESEEETECIAGTLPQLKA